MYKTTDSQQLKPKKRNIVSGSLKQ